MSMHFQPWEMVVCFSRAHFLTDFCLTSHVRPRQSDDCGGSANHIVSVLVTMGGKVYNRCDTAIGAVWSRTDPAALLISEQVHVVERIRGQNL